MELKLTGQKRNNIKTLESKNNLNVIVKQSVSKSRRKNSYHNTNSNPIKEEDLSTHLNELSLNNNTSTKKRNLRSESKQTNTNSTDNDTANNISNAIKENRRIKVLKQIEFYFSDENLLTDKHLKGLILSSQENAVKIAEIGKFKRIQLLLKNFSDEDIFKYIQHTVKTFSNFLKLSTNGKSIKRIDPYNFTSSSESINEINKRTLYVENLPKHIFHDKVHEVFSKYGFIKHSSLPRHKESNQSKGFGFIIYSTIEEMNSAIKAFEKPFVPIEFKQKKYKGVLKPLIVMCKEDWLIRKNELKSLCKIK